MVEQVEIFSAPMTGEDWIRGMMDKEINNFLAEKNEKGEHKGIARVLQSVEGRFLVITIFYQWVKGEPDLGPFRTAPKGE